MTTVVCVWVRGHVPFTAEYVCRLASMVKRWMDRPYRFVCLTDRPHFFRGTQIEAISIRPPANCVAWWTKVQLFRTDLGLTGRVLYLDLDTLIVASLQPIVDYPAPFALIPHGGSYRPKHGHRIVCRFNSSVMVWNAGEQSHIFDRWQPLVTEDLHGDQDWIGEQCETAAKMPIAWFPRLSQITAGPPFPDEAKVVLAKVPKNDLAAKRWPWFNAIWRAA